MDSTALLFLSHQRKKSTLSGFVHHPQSGEGIISTPYRPFVPLPNLWTSSQEYKDFDSFVSVKFKTCNQRNRAATCFGWPKLGKRFVWIHENQERNGCLCIAFLDNLKVPTEQALQWWRRCLNIRWHHPRGNPKKVQYHLPILTHPKHQYKFNVGLKFTYLPWFALLVLSVWFSPPKYVLCLENPAEPIEQTKQERKKPEKSDKQTIYCLLSIPRPRYWGRGRELNKSQWEQKVGARIKRGAKTKGPVFRSGIMPP